MGPRGKSEVAAAAAAVAPAGWRSSVTACAAVAASVAPSRDFCLWYLGTSDLAFGILVNPWSSLPLLGKAFFGWRVTARAPPPDLGTLGTVGSWGKSEGAAAAATVVLAGYCLCYCCCFCCALTGLLPLVPWDLGPCVRVSGPSSQSSPPLLGKAGTDWNRANSDPWDRAQRLERCLYP